MDQNCTVRNSTSNLSAKWIMKISPGMTFVAILLSCCSLLTILGNSLVIIAVLKERCLRSVTNYFIVSLAAADLVMGLIVMPFAVSEEILQGVWIYGSVWCDFWHATDVWSSTCSILNLCAIAVERYYATHNPILHAARISRQRSGFTIAGIWLFSAIISFPAILWWQARMDYPRNKNECPFTNDSSYLLLSSILSFYMPLVIMVFVYYKIYKIATDTLRSLKSGFRVIKDKSEHGDTKIILNVHRGVNIDSHSSRSPSIVTPFEIDSKKVNYSPCVNTTKFFCDDGKPIDRSSFQQSLNNYSSHLSPRFHQTSPSVSKLKSENIYMGRGDSRYSLCLEPNFGNSSPHSRSSIASPVKVLTNKLCNIISGKRAKNFLRDQRAAKTLGIVMGIFVLCWLPFFVCNILVAIDGEILKPNTKTSKIVITVVTWLGYVNSSINPIIYAHSMRDFRMAFVKILTCLDLKSWLCRTSEFENSRKLSGFNSDFYKSKSILGINMKSASSNELHFKDEMTQSVEK